MASVRIIDAEGLCLEIVEDLNDEAPKWLQSLDGKPLSNAIDLSGDPLKDKLALSARKQLTSPRFDDARRARSASAKITLV